MFSKWSSKKTPSPISSPVPSPVNSLSRSSETTSTKSPPSSPLPGSSPVVVTANSKTSTRGRQMVPLNDQKDKEARSWSSRLRLRSLSKHKNRPKSPDRNTELEIKTVSSESENFERDLLELPVLNDMAPLTPLTQTFGWFQPEEIENMVTSMNFEDTKDDSELLNVLQMRNSLADSHTTLNDEDDKIINAVQSKNSRDLQKQELSQQISTEYDNSNMEEWRNSQTVSTHSSSTYVDRDKVLSSLIVSPISTAAIYANDDDGTIDEKFNQHENTFYDEFHSESNLDKNVSMLRHHGRSRVSVLDIEKMIRDLDFSVDQLQQDALDLESLEAELKATLSPTDTEASSHFDFNIEEIMNEKLNLESDDLNQNKSSKPFNLLGISVNENIITDQQLCPLSPDLHPFIPTSGYLSKLQQKGVFKTWKRRFFILSPNRIYYFQTKYQTDTSLGHITLNSKSDCFVSSHSSFDGKHVFEIVTPVGDGIQTKSVFLLCDGKDEMLNWIKGIRNAILNQRATKVTAELPTPVSLFSRELDNFGTLESTSSNLEKFDTLDSVNSFVSLERFRNQLQRNSSLSSTEYSNSNLDSRPQSFQQPNISSTNSVSSHRSTGSTLFSPSSSYNTRMDPSLVGLQMLAEISSPRQSFSLPISPLSQAPVGSWENQEFSNNVTLLLQRQNSGRLSMAPVRYEDLNTRKASSLGYSNSLSSRHQGTGRIPAPIDSPIKSALDLLDQIDISQRGRNSNN
ncbi:hypothetical protein HK096_005133 [Nowakowskiella sp. JEL0078]|nr:hypothetical protein HK096_005133 [Nowakowskiella sp. JEL0078]